MTTLCDEYWKTTLTAIPSDFPIILPNFICQTGFYIFRPLLDNILKFSGFRLEPEFLAISISVQTSAKSVHIFDFDPSFIEFNHLRSYGSK